MHPEDFTDAVHESNPQGLPVRSQERLDAAQVSVDEQPESADDALRRVIEVLAHRLEPGASEPRSVLYRPDALTPDQVAELCQMTPAAAQPEANNVFWRLAVRHFEPPGFMHCNDSNEDLWPWMALIRLMADLAGHHVRGCGLGQALAHSDVSEDAFDELVRAQGRDVFLQLVSVLEDIRDHHKPLDFVDVARLLLSDCGSAGERMKVRRQLLADYCANLSD